MSRKAKNPRLQIIPLGGLGEIGKNLTVFEYMDDIIVVDLGSILKRIRIRFEVTSLPMVMRTISAPCPTWCERYPRLSMEPA